MVRYWHFDGFNPWDFILRSTPDTAAIIGMVIIASGIIIMNLFSKMGSEEAEETPVTNLDKKIAN